MARIIIDPSSSSSYYSIENNKLSTMIATRERPMFSAFANALERGAWASTMVGELGAATVSAMGGHWRKWRVDSVSKL